MTSLVVAFMACKSHANFIGGVALGNRVDDSAHFPKPGFARFSSFTSLHHPPRHPRPQIWFVRLHKNICA
jgi:hypothetical protein